MYKSKNIEIFHRNIGYFLSCAPFSSLNIAAKKIGITQSALSLSIQKLEEELGIKLFHRTKGGVTLTEKGHATYDALLRLREQAARDLMNATTSSHSVPLRVGAVEHFGAKFLFPLIDSTDKPGALQLYLMRSLQVYEAVTMRRLDVGFVTWSSRPKDVESIPLHREPLSVVGLRSRYAHIETAKKIEDLRSERWIYTPKPQYDWTGYIDQNAEGVVCGGFFSHVRAVMSGLGIAEAQLDAFTSQEISKLAVASFPAPRSAMNYAIYRSDHSPEILGRVQKLVRLIKSSVRPQAGE